MQLLGFNRTIRVLFYCFLVVLIFGIISLFIANSITNNYRKSREELVGQIENDKQLSQSDFREMGYSIQAINEKFHSFESVAIYQESDNRALSYYDMDVKEAAYVFPSELNQNDWMNELFIGAEGFEAGNFFIVHRDFIDWYYVFPFCLFSISGVLFLLWLILQVKHVYTGRIMKINLSYKLVK
ncbi:hypothetical protein CEQ21_02455 [Niallia circulans]|uniref:Two-component sensor histidine kinase n=1 Tax=Niallia circulans TaxID=1397 RepID=A0A553SS53_NIACI|nr:hypothetical protein [Niallia circulans]TRZ39827.1 hypothetical protein CEQ21_02455 [Niallia circulans]